MGLEKSVESFLGSVVFVRPVYGWGWNESESGRGEAKMAVPDPFHMRLDRFFSVAGKQRAGGVGQVDEVNHPLNEKWIVFAARHVGTWNFTDTIGHYNILVWDRDPRGNKEGWPVPETEAAFSANGFAEIADSDKGMNRLGPTNR